MFRSGIVLLGLVLACANGMRAFDLKQLDQEVFDRLAKKARESVTITLDGSMLKAAKNFLPSDEAGGASLQKLVDGLTSVTVRTFEFKGNNEYTDADLDLIRREIRSRTPVWKQIVDVKEEEESTQIYLLPGATGQDKPQGLFIIAAEPAELSVVQIEGPIDLTDLASLKGLGVDLGRIEERTKR